MDLPSHPTTHQQFSTCTQIKDHLLSTLLKPKEGIPLILLSMRLSLPLLPVVHRQQPPPLLKAVAATAVALGVLQGTAREGHPGVMQRRLQKGDIWQC